jgi:hypothetical protein
MKAHFVSWASILTVFDQVNFTSVPLGQADTINLNPTDFDFIFFAGMNVYVAFSYYSSMPLFLILFSDFNSSCF